MFKVDDLVIIKEDKKPYIYRIAKIEQINKNKIYHLIGYSYRMNYHANEEEIIHASAEQIQAEDKVSESYFRNVKKNTGIRRQRGVLFGRILHLDGDSKFLDSCLNLYKEMHLFAQGLHLAERNVKTRIEELITTLTPDIIVITGHDAYNKQGFDDLNNYENSINFIEAIRVIRKHYSLDEMVVIAGACASHFEALIASGANFASSPERVNTHTYDPAVVAIKVATTAFNRIIEFGGILKYIENGRAAIGGIETYGKMRLLL